MSNTDINGISFNASKITQWAKVFHDHKKSGTNEDERKKVINFWNDELQRIKFLETTALLNFRIPILPIYNKINEILKKQHSVTIPIETEIQSLFPQDKSSAELLKKIKETIDTCGHSGIACVEARPIILNLMKYIAVDYKNIKDATEIYNFLMKTNSSTATDTTNNSDDVFETFVIYTKATEQLSEEMFSEEVSKLENFHKEVKNVISVKEGDGGHVTGIQLGENTELVVSGKKEKKCWDDKGVFCFEIPSSFSENIDETPYFEGAPKREYKTYEGSMHDHQQQHEYEENQRKQYQQHGYEHEHYEQDTVFGVPIKFSQSMVFKQSVSDNDKKRILYAFKYIHKLDSIEIEKEKYYFIKGLPIENPKTFMNDDETKEKAYLNLFNKIEEIQIDDKGNVERFKYNEQEWNKK
jgi:hypothetical protein